MLDEFEDIHPSDIDAMDTIDAMVFNGDSLHTFENVATFRKLLKRWSKQVNSVEKILIEIERDELIEKYVGKSVKVININVVTHGKLATVKNFDRKINKFMLDFGNGFVGWYTEKEIELKE